MQIYDMPAVRPGLGVPDRNPAHPVTGDEPVTQAPQRRAGSGEVRLGEQQVGVPVGSRLLLVVEALRERRPLQQDRWDPGLV